MNTEEFVDFIVEKGAELYRPMPWRDTTDPYAIMVSELMLQQTQVSRVIPKYLAFMERFPTTKELAEATIAEVIAMWQGLGYNRRARYLQLAAIMITAEHAGVFPCDYKELLALPGVGPNTAGAIMAYAYDERVSYIETNVRTVYFHHFFANADAVSDRQISELLEKTLPTVHVREFYWALMDYGAWLKRFGVRSNAKSVHYRRQAPLEGSVRQVRGKIIKLLVQRKHMSIGELSTEITDDVRLEKALSGLQKDGLITVEAEKVHLTK